MKAWIWYETEKKPVLKEINDPDISTPDETRVDVLYSSINHRDVWISKGKYPKIKLPCVLGSDACGLSEGRHVILNPGFAWGKNEKVQSELYHILGMPTNGTFAEKVVVEKRQLHEKPGHLSPEEAASIPLAGVTAFRAFVLKCNPLPGQKVLITGIGGGVSQWVMLFAKALGCEIFVTSTSPEKLKRAKNLGVSDGVCTLDKNWPVTLKTKSGGVDIVIDSVMGPLLPELIKICNPGASLCFYGASGGVTQEFQPHVLFWRQISIYGSTMGSDLDFRNMVDFINKHKITPVVDSIFSFKNLPLAFERMEASAQFGKIIIDHSRT